LEEIETQFDGKGLESAFKPQAEEVNAIMTMPGPLFAERKRIVDCRQISVAGYPPQRVCR
jgi:hypothetical protein